MKLSELAKDKQTATLKMMWDTAKVEIHGDTFHSLEMVGIFQEGKEDEKKCLFKFPSSNVDIIFDDEIEITEI